MKTIDPLKDIGKLILQGNQKPLPKGGELTHINMTNIYSRRGPHTVRLRLLMLPRVFQSIFSLAIWFHAFSPSISKDFKMYWFSNS